MAGSGGFGVTISAVDNASKSIDSVNKRLAALQAPAERFNKALVKFGDTSGINRVSEGVTSLGRSAATAFRNLDSMASPLAAITGAASIAGIVELSRRWGEFGTQIGQVAYRVNAPVEKLSALRGAMRLAGGFASDLDNGMRGLGDTLNDAAYGRDRRAVQLFNQLGIATRDASGNVRKADDALGDVADKIQNLPANTQSRILGDLGLGDGFLPLLKNGRQGLTDFQKQAEQTGGVMTGQMVDAATKMNKSWNELGLTIEGVGNRLEDKYAPAVTSIIERTAKWIENNKSTADSIAEIGSAVGVLAALKPAAWLLRLLGLGALTGPVAATAGAMLGVGAYNGSVNAPMVDDYGRITGTWGGGAAPDTNYTPGAAIPGNPIWNRAGGWWSRHAPSWLGGSALPADIEAEVRRQAAAKGLDPEHMVRLAQVEHGGYDNVSRAGAIGPMQLMPGTAADMAVDPHNWHQNVAGGSSYYRQLLNRFHGNYAAADAAYNAGPNNPGVGLFASSGDPSGLPAETRNYVSSINGPGALQGHVQVDVHLKGATAGTTAQVTTTGPVSAPPPRIETPMPGVH